MADSLFPTFTLPTITITTSDNDPVYNGSFLFDFDKGDFVQDGAGRVVAADPYQAWLQWCVKCVITEWNTYPIYDENFGCETNEALTEPSRDKKQTDLEQTITEALLADARTQSVTDFTFGWEDDGCNLSFTITPTVGTPQRVEVFVGGS
jgi:hypothetical protein